ncbi:hypothetical protein [Thermococcus sp.]
MNVNHIKYWFLVSIAFTLTQPGAVSFANWDEPYGFYKDLSVWLACAGAFLTLVLLYGLVLWLKNRLSLIHPLATALLIVVVFSIGYWAEGFIRGQMEYGSSNVLTFILGGFIGLFLALMLLPTAVHYFIAGGVYPHDRPLFLVWLISLTLSSALLFILTKRENSRNRKAKSFKNHPQS